MVGTPSLAQKYQTRTEAIVSGKHSTTTTITAITSFIAQAKGIPFLVGRPGYQENTMVSVAFPKNCQVII
jgi:hypothetical protein